MMARCAPMLLYVARRAPSLFIMRVAQN
ncbi:hypothetical protein A2U01_0100145, partial [Trifolium medium]|nr:hypothetical protein [Trifolium medium]